MVDATRKRLTPFRRIPTRRWLQRLDATVAVLLQVGAFNHNTDAGSFDNAPFAINKHNWSAVLIEPQPPAFAALRALYARSDRVRLLNAAVCDACTGTGAEFYSVDMSNSTGNYGTDRADARCALTEAPGIAEVASLSRHHVLRQQYLYKWSPKRCARCSARVGRPLRPNCMSKVITENIRTQRVECACLRDAAAQALQLLPTAAPPAVSLLLVDAEGHDYAVLRGFPFSRVPVWRVVFEATWMDNADYDRAAALLREHGFERVIGKYKAAQSVWHHANSSEVLKARAPVP